ncbi:putative disease resistance protein At3g14460 [Hevea brasiliensis]|uniref:putative disease resistance protein At3g14460 n=1 Tax=Hevea brasiliensis TaxID=3981 RepID=UPI0025D2FE05|nr:putative disease resistance protein At3g14460 [Hevea brasiliensis]
MVDLSDSISKFKLLRYLNLSGTSIKSFSTPTKLYFLQILILRECPNLVALPSNMSKLIKLCHLDIRGTELQEMPPQMGELKKLRKLTDFFLGKQSVSSIKELGKLQELQGELCIWNLQHVEKAKDAAEANLCGKEKLVKLELRWDWDIQANIDPKHEKSVLESLEPHKGLDYLSIYGYGGTRFPDWVGHSSFSCMVSLELSGCGNCSSLPPLGQLPSLEYLTIESFNKVEVVGREFYGSCTSMKKPFGSLKVLRFSYMRGWREWISCEGAFPVLQELHVRRSDNLKKAALPGHLPCLTILDVGGCQQFAAALRGAPAIFRVMTADVQLEKLPSGLYSLISYRFEFATEIMERIGLLPNALEEIVIYDSYSLGSFPLKLFSEVKTLKVGRCGNLDDFFTPEANANFTSLDSLEIKECRYFVSFPEGGLPASNLTRLSLYDCSSLKSLPQNMRSLLSSLVDLSILRCPALESFPKDGLPSSLSSLSIRYCPQLEPFPKGCLPEKLESLDVGHDCNKLIAGHMQWDLQTLPSLVKIAIESCDDVVAFPGEMLLPSTLISLEINGFQNLKSIDYKGLQDLKNLTVVNCPKLELFLGGVLPSQLESLRIYQCSKLIAHLMHWDLRAVSSLLELTIDGYDGVDMVSFPGKMLLPSALTSLNLYSLENLKFLDKGLLHLTSLKKLRIDRCYNLQSLPEEGLPSSITSLDIVVCRLLQPKCELGGEYWPLISQIPQVMMD